MENCKTIVLVENDKILQNSKAIENTFINYFTNLIDCLGLKKIKIGLEEPLLRIV